MKTLILIRHAKSLKDAAYSDDHERPLNEVGIKDAPLLGKFLKKEKIFPDLVISSTALRAKMTTELILEELNPSINVVYDSRLYFEDHNSILNIISEIDNSINKIMIIGHNPDIFNLTDKIIKEDFPYPKFSTCGVAIINFKIDDWYDILENKGKLSLYKSPNMLKTS